MAAHRGAMSLYDTDKRLLVRYTYESKAKIREIIQNYDMLLWLARRGCEAAMCIRADIEGALNREDAGTPYRHLTRHQAECVYHHLVMGIPQVDVAEMLGTSQPAVSKAVSLALSKLYVLLLEPCFEEQERWWDELNEAYQKATSVRCAYFES